MAGILFSVNGYIPMILCLIMTIFSIYLSSKFKDIDEREKVSINKIRGEFKELINSFRLFGKSPRLKNLIFFCALISAIMLSITMLRSSIMQDIGIPSQYFGVIFAILWLVSGISAKN